MNKEDLEQWHILREQLKNGWYLSDWDKQELIRLNHLVMEASHEIHNKNMMHDL